MTNMTADQPQSLHWGWGWLQETARPYSPCSLKETARRYSPCRLKETARTYSPCSLKETAGRSYLLIDAGVVGHYQDRGQATRYAGRQKQQGGEEK